MKLLLDTGLHKADVGWNKGAAALLTLVILSCLVCLIGTCCCSLRWAGRVEAKKEKERQAREAERERARKEREAAKAEEEAAAKAKAEEEAAGGTEHWLGC